MNPVFQPSARRHRTAAAVLLLVLVLVLAQTLGWLHRGLHGGAEPDRQPQHAVQAVHDDAVQPSANWITALFAGHTDDSDCRLFDVLGKPGCAAAAPIALPHMAAMAFLACSSGEFVARWAALFQARGPPSSR